MVLANNIITQVLDGTFHLLKWCISYYIFLCHEIFLKIFFNNNSIKADTVTNDLIIKNQLRLFVLKV